MSSHSGHSLEVKRSKKSVESQQTGVFLDGC